MSSTHVSNEQHLRATIGENFKMQLADLDAASGVCAEILGVLRLSVEMIESRLHRQVAMRTDTYETERIAKKRSAHQKK